MEYPTRGGISIPSSELELPETRLDLSQNFTTNNHHMEWSRRNMGRFLITQTLRDLTLMQEELPIDVHAYLHKIYEPPQFPTIKQAMSRVVLARARGETLNLKADVGYHEHEISNVHWKQIELEYNRLKD